jgi:hypothetical protein
MNWFDTANGLFEIVGGIAVWVDVAQIFRDKKSAGIHPAAMAFFTIWALWNIFYYFHLSQWFSLWAGVPLAIGDLFWFILMIKYKTD